jgi:hypothetical protein
MRILYDSYQFCISRTYNNPNLHLECPNPTSRESLFPTTRIEARIRKVHTHLDFRTFCDSTAIRAFESGDLNLHQVLTSWSNHLSLTRYLDRWIQARIPKLGPHALVRLHRFNSIADGPPHPATDLCWRATKRWRWRCIFAEQFVKKERSGMS